MKTCKEKLPDGKPCPNQVDDGQEYCFYHLANKTAKEKKIFSIATGALSVLGLVAVGIYKVAKFAVTKKL
ncbi:MAG: hypothetical protein QY328_10310 [Anaerolineales bacterium]|nr:MAG: hypothetical protein QY328_10310 [Anaerolineales bacterium]